MSVSFIAELSPVYCCLVRSVFVFLPVLSVDGFWLMMMMMAMTICFTEATRLLESSGSTVSVSLEEEQQYNLLQKRQIKCLPSTSQESGLPQLWMAMVILKFPKAENL